VLHVLGHDHADPAEGSRMRERELTLLQMHHWHGDVPTGFRQEHES
jgi:probable rRNA maturation factor